MSNKNAARYLPFDALKGLKESINLVNEEKNKVQMPQLSEDQVYNMDVTMMRCYGNKSIVQIEYIVNGIKKNECGVIENIDLIDRALIIHPKKKIYINNIVDISERK